jgi:hypothetical protein
VFRLEEVDMKKLLALSFAALAVGCAPSEPVELSAAEQGLLAQELRGRTAGPTVACVNQRDLRGNRSIGEGVILFDGPVGTVYVNRPAAGCPVLDSSRALITRTTSTQLCRGDIATVVDPVSNFSYGACSLGDFTPYRRTP